MDDHKRDEIDKITATSRSCRDPFTVLYMILPRKVLPQLCARLADATKILLIAEKDHVLEPLNGLIL